MENANLFFKFFIFRSNQSIKTDFVSCFIVQPEHSVFKKYLKSCLDLMGYICKYGNCVGIWGSSLALVIYQPLKYTYVQYPL